MNSLPTDEKVAEFRHSVLAKCYQNANDDTNFQKEKLLVSKKELIDQLED